jgi:hypothetical protein
MSTNEPTGRPADAVFLPTERSEQAEYEFIVREIDALLGRLDVQMPIARARLDLVLEQIKSRLPR